eukprot:766933-Hanusia_phi.AAC.5
MLGAKLEEKVDAREGGGGGGSDLLTGLADRLTHARNSLLLPGRDGKGREERERRAAEADEVNPTSQPLTQVVTHKVIEASLLSLLPCPSPGSPTRVSGLLSPRATVSHNKENAILSPVLSPILSPRRHPSEVEIKFNRVSHRSCSCCCTCLCLHAPADSMMQEILHEKSEDLKQDKQRKRDTSADGRRAGDIKVLPGTPSCSSDPAAASSKHSTCSSIEHARAHEDR